MLPNRSPLTLALLLATVLVPTCASASGKASASPPRAAALAPPAHKYIEFDVPGDTNGTVAISVSHGVVRHPM